VSDLLPNIPTDTLAVPDGASATRGAGQIGPGVDITEEIFEDLIDFVVEVRGVADLFAEQFLEALFVVLCKTGDFVNRWPKGKLYSLMTTRPSSESDGSVNWG
jgi:hypothetical protein